MTRLTVNTAAGPREVDLDRIEALAERVAAAGGDGIAALVAAGFATLTDPIEPDLEPPPDAAGEA